MNRSAATPTATSGVGGRALLLRAAEHPEQAGTFYDHPMLRLQVGGRRAYPELDVVAFQIRGKFHVIEIKSFAMIDGQTDEESAAAANRS